MFNEKHKYTRNMFLRLHINCLILYLHINKLIWKSLEIYFLFMESWRFDISVLIFKHQILEVKKIKFYIPKEIINIVIYIFLIYL